MMKQELQEVPLPFFPSKKLKNKFKNPFSPPPLQETPNITE